MGGNGAITVSDWVQAGRYAAGLDPATPAMGPSAPVDITPLAVFPARATRFEKLGWERAYVRLGSAEPVSSETVVLPVQVWASGRENALGFSLTFDPAGWQFERIEMTGASEGAALLLNVGALAQGRVGIALALPPEAAWPMGLTKVANLHFRGQGSLTVAWADTPIARELVDTEGRALEADFLPPEGEGVAPVLSGSISAGMLLLRWSHFEAGWVLEQARTLAVPVWTPLSTLPIRLGGMSEVRVHLSGDQGFYRLRYTNPTYHHLPAAEGN